MAAAIARLADLAAMRPTFSWLRVSESLIGTLVGAAIGLWSGLLFRRLQLRREQHVACMRVAIILQRQTTDFINTKNHVERERAARLAESPGAPLWIQYRLIDEFGDERVAQDASALATGMTGETGSLAMNAILEVDMKYRLFAGLHTRVNELRSEFNEHLEQVTKAAGGNYRDGVPGTLIEQHIDLIPMRVRYEYESRVANLFIRLDNDKTFYEEAVRLFNVHAKALAPRLWLIGPRAKPINVKMLTPNDAPVTNGEAKPSFAPRSAYRTGV